MSETITVVGNITQPELKVTPNGVQILNFRIASTERRYDKGEDKWIDGATSWYSVSAFRKLAEHASRSLRKGDRVVVTGRLRLRDWETTAKKGVTAEIDADALGHDLLWGVTTFHRSGGQAPAESQTSPSAWAAPGVPAEGGQRVDEWATITPGAESPGWDATPAEGETDAVAPEQGEVQRELVGAGTDTPF